ncbi:urea amidolyase family protein [Orrella sp. JC864]|uniref:5-oxoprolinase subunit B/C family protein n=1 Tax=Orrella sp. JC864 TaxID=3120298 RepID=UPI003008DD79
MRFLPVNLNALLVELDDLDQTLSLLHALEREPVAGVVELVPAARTILVTFRPALRSARDIVADIAARRLDARIERSAPLVEIPVHYDGEDLDEVAGMLGLSRQEVVARHTGREYSVAFTGFAPGFAYLSGGDPGLDVPRRSSPRTRIPPGAVALAGTFSGIYPQASPGGWQLLGSTPLAMWDLGREIPALLQPGYRVRFVDAARLSEAQLQALIERSRGRRVDAGRPARAAQPGPRHGLTVLAAGLQTLFQDSGRHGQAGQGVAASGAMDQQALRAANRLVGNAPGSACLETTYGGLALQASGPLVLAVAGAQAPLEITAADGRRWTAAPYRALALDEGDVLRIGEPAAGLRCYVAARGGFAIEPVLGSCATDTLAHVGPPAVAAGDFLPVRPAPAGAIVADFMPAPDKLPRAGEVVTLDVVMGPRTDWFTGEAVRLLAAQTWEVTAQSNRVGIRLAGEQPLARARQGELPSEGTSPGAIQVPPSGQPVLFLADHPLTGGYPVIAAVATHHLDLAGQIPIGARIRFNPLTTFKTLSPHASDPRAGHAEPAPISSPIP